MTPRPAWRLRDRGLAAEGVPSVMGIVNVTPDSFSDGGRWLDPERAIDHALRLAAEGAAILDVGGESTRPGADSVDADEELRRVLPVIRALSRRSEAAVSIDTSKASVARAAIDAGADIVNDVTGLEGDPEMVGVVAGAGVSVCVMHMRGTPRTMQANPEYRDVVSEVKRYLAERVESLASAGIDRERICVDPGIGFGKTTRHNLELLRRIDELHEIGCPLLVGHSRKRFLGELLGDAGIDRDAATVGVSLAMASRGVQVLRVHEVRSNVDALTAFVSCQTHDAPLRR